MRVRIWTVVAVLALAAGLRAVEIGPVLEKVRPSVVQVSFSEVAENGSQAKRIGIGTIVDKDGLVALSADLLPRNVPDDRFVDFKAKMVGWEDAPELEAAFVTRDSDLTVALIRITEKPKNGKEFVPVTPGNAADLKPGDELYGIGLLPASYQSTVTFSEGHAVKYIEKPQPLVVVTRSANATLFGPVLNAKGEVAGFSVQDPLFNMQAYRARNAGNEPANVILPYARLADLLKEPRKTRKRTWMGVSDLQFVSKDVALVLGLPEDHGGVLIGRILAGQPAEQAGLKAEDVIVKVDGEDLKVKDDNGLRTFQERMKKFEVGQKAKLIILRGKETKDVEITMGEKPKEENEAQRFEDKDLGLVLRELTYYDTLARDEPPEYAGLFVHYVKSGSWPELGGMRPGDILTKIEDTDLKGNTVETFEQFKKIISDLKEHKKKNFVFYVSRGKKGQNAAIIKIEADWK
ncbi:MAG: PDZ domain-containing protein [Planctomycetes bacterium]|nr:PDZ domain-containing protein [Planctomycetota bacterium]